MIRIALVLIAIFSSIPAQANFWDDLFGRGRRFPSYPNPSYPYPGYDNGEEEQRPKVNPRQPVTSQGRLAPGSTTAAVWETTNEWNAQWEKEFERWVQTSWTTDIFTSPSSDYNGLLPDCADAVYSMRAIFAFEHGLPFAVVDPSTQRTVFSNTTTKFKHYRQGSDRVVAFLFWLYDILGTTTLGTDSIPVLIDRQNVRPGGFLLAKESKHSYTIKKLRDTGVPTLYYSTQANDGTLLVRSWPSENFLFAEGILPPSGIRYYRTPDQLLKPEWEVPGFSKEQYSFPAGRFIQTAQRMLSVRNESGEEALKRHMEDICQLTNTRASMVAKAYDWLEANPGRCMGSKDYDDMSTPSRDRQIKQAYVELKKVYDTVIRDRTPLTKTVAEQVANIFASSGKNEKGSQYCRIEHIEGRYISLGEWRRRLFNERFSSNPNDPYTVRWGEVMGPSDQAERCPTY